MAETVVLKVAMSCQGCAGAVQRAITKMEGVDSFNVDLKEQKVTVIGSVKAEDVFQTVSRTGKRTSFWEAEPEADPAIPETKIELPSVPETEVRAPAVPETKTESAAPSVSADTGDTTAVPAVAAAATADPATPATA